MTFTTEEEALKLANDTEYGLGSAVFTKDGVSLMIGRGRFCLSDRAPGIQAHLNWMLH